jgi:hypothetical protein
MLRIGVGGKVKREKFKIQKWVTNNKYRTQMMRMGRIKTDKKINVKIQEKNNRQHLCECCLSAKKKSKAS